MVNKKMAQSAPDMRDEELYAQISAGDQEMAQEKPRDSLIMSLMVKYMRLTLALDEKRREYQKLFHILAQMWMTLMGGVYLCGLIMFGILVGSYFRFPTYVEEYLAKNGLYYDKKEIPGYIFSQVDLYGLHDKENMYKIDKVSLSSTFADFLNKRAKSLTLSGVQINVPAEAKKGEDILTKIARLNQFATRGAGVRVDSLEISNATLRLKGQNYELPITFSLTGVYGRDTNISAFLKIDQPHLKVSGPLTIKKTGDKTKWDFIIHSGQVALPNRPSETLGGTISFESRNGEVLSTKSQIDLKFETLKKTLILNADRVGPTFKGDINFKWTDISDSEKPVDRTTIGLNFGKIAIDSTGKVESSTPLTLKVSSNYFTNAFLNELTATLDGNLNCQLFDSCSFQLKKAPMTTVQEVQFPVQGNRLKNLAPVRISLKPVDDMLHLSFKEGDSYLHLELDRLPLTGQIVDTKEKFSMMIGSTKLQSQFNIWTKKLNTNLEMDRISYQTPGQEMTNGKLIISNLLEKGEKITLTTPKMVIKDNRYLNVPFGATVVKEGNRTNAAVSLAGNQARLLFDGYLDLNGGVVNGLLVIPPVQLGRLPQPLNRLSSLIPADLKSVSGEIMGYGHLIGNTRAGIQGPFYLGLSNMGIKTDNINVQNLNTALTLSSVMPLLSEPDQPVFVGKIDSFFPITDVNFDLQLGSRFAQLSGFKAMMLGIPLVSEEILLPYHEVATLVYLKNQNYDLSDVIKNISLKNWQIVGSSQGNVLFPLEVKDFVLKLKSTSIQLMNMTLKYKGADKPAFMGKDSEFTIRSGNITVDRDEDHQDQVKAALTMDIELMPSRVKKAVREVYTGRVLDALSITPDQPMPVPDEIKKNIHRIRRQTSQFQPK